MELLETHDPEKRKLFESSQRHRKEMEREIKDISEKSEKILKNVLIIGGALALTYVVVSQLSSSKTKKRKAKKNVENEDSIQIHEGPENETPSLLSKMGDKAINMATMLLLDIAKEKLSEYLQHRKSSNENS
jgi:hypothetical protein